MDRSVNPNLTLYVHTDEAHPEKIRSYLLTVGNRPGRLFHLPQPIDPKPFLEEMVSLQEAKEKEDDYLVEALKNLGDILSLQLLPKSILQRLWEERHGEPSLVIVLNQELSVPWELLRLFNPNKMEEKGDFFGKTFAMSRMILSDHQEKWPSHLPPGRMCVAKGDTKKLAWAEKEMKWLGKRHKIPVSRIETKFEFTEQLPLNESSIWHFVGHARRLGKFSSALEFADGSFHLTDLGVGSGIFARTRPFVFINACQSGKAVNGLNGCESWAKGFLSKGATGFLGAQWNVNDEAAYLFASEFYTSFFAGNTLGHAVMRARMASFAKAPMSSLAYALYGNPDTRLMEESDAQLDQCWEAVKASNDWDVLHQPLLEVLTALQEPVPLDFLSYFDQSISSASLSTWYQTWDPWLVRTDDQELGLLIQPEPTLRTKVQRAMDLTDTHRRIATTLKALA